MSNLNDITERWLPVDGYAGLYEVSSEGRVLSLSREIFMKPQTSETMKYPTLRLTNAQGVAKTHYIHALVLTTFVGPRPAGADACHGDGNKQNNRLSNLRWDTRSANAADRDLHGTSTVGERHPAAKLTDDAVRALRKRRSEGASFTTLAKEFGVTRMTAHRAAAGNSWSHVE